MFYNCQAFEQGPGAITGGDAVPDPGGPPPRGTDQILKAMRSGETYRLEDLEAATGLAAAPLMARLTRLEVEGWVARSEGGRYVTAGANVLR